VVPNSQNPKVWVQQGRTLYEAGQFSDAIAILQQAAAAFKASGDTLHLSMTLSNLSLAYQQLGQWIEAEQAITQSLNLLQPTPNNSTEHLKLLAQALEVKGKLQLTVGKSEDALILWQDSAAKYTRVGNEIGAIRSQIHQSIALQELGYYRQAFKTLIPPTQWLQTQPDSLLKATAFRTLGNILRVVGNVEELEASIPLLQQAGKKLNYLEQSQQLLQQSLEISDKFKSPQDSAESLLGLGNTLRAAYYRSKDAYNRAPTQNAPREAQNQALDAITFYQQAATKTVSPSLRIQSQLNQLSLFSDFEQWLLTIKTNSVPKSALQQLQTQLTPLSTLQSEIDSLPASRTAVYARINLAKSLMKRDSLLTPSVSNLNTLQSLLVQSVQQAQTLDDKRAQAYAIGHFGGLYEKTGQLSQAQYLTQKALILTEGIHASDIAYQWQAQLGRVLKKQGKIEGAIAAYQEAVNSLNSLRQDLVGLNNPDASFFFRDDVEPVYRELVDLLLQPASTAINRAGTKQEQKDKTQEVKSLQDNLIQARQVVQDLQVAELENFLRCSLPNAKGLSIDKVVDQNNLNAAIIYPIVLDERLEIILKLPKQENLYRYTLPNVYKYQVESTIEQLRTAIKDEKSGKTHPSFKQLYDWLLRPVESDLQNSQIETLVFVLDGALRNIPLAALYDGKKYLVEKYSIAVNLGLKLQEDQPLKKGDLNVLAGGLSESVLGLSPLPFVKQELEQIKSQIPTSKVLLDRQFTSQGFQKEINSRPFTIVHLATHGLFSSSPDETYIVAYGERININQLDKLLRQREENRPKSIELLVLSACQTAIGDKRAALGIAGVSVRAGARSTIASLFDVRDNSTPLLMKEFYQKLSQPNVTRVQALQRAQIALLNNEDYQKPYHWAPFVLVGNWR
jgi:CHAT domain-containing protein